MSNRNYKVPLSDSALRIVNRYRKRLPTYHINRTNLCLKKIAAQCGIDKSLTFNVARRTFKESLSWLDYPQNVLYKITELLDVKKKNVYVPKNENKVNAFQSQ